MTTAAPPASNIGWSGNAAVAIHALGLGHVLVLVLALGLGPAMVIVVIASHTIVATKKGAAETAIVIVTGGTTTMMSTRVAVVPAVAKVVVRPVEATAIRSPRRGIWIPTMR